MGLRRGMVCSLADLWWLRVVVISQGGFREGWRGSPLDGRSLQQHLERLIAVL